MGIGDTAQLGESMREMGTVDGFVPVYVDDFSGHSLGTISDEQNAVNEFHYRRPSVERGAWTDVSVHYSYPGHGVCWRIEEAGNSRVLVQPGFNREIREGWKRWVRKRLLRRRIPRVLFYPAFVLGYRYSNPLLVRTILSVGSPDHFSGMLWGMTHARSHYFLAIRGGRLVLGLRDGEREEQIAARRVPIDSFAYHHLEALLEPQQVRCLLDGRELIRTSLDNTEGGKVGVFANVPTRFARFEVWKPSDERPPKRLGRPQDLIDPALTSRYAPMELRRRLSLPSPPSGRSLRFGALESPGRVDILIAQGTPLKGGDNYNALTCLTAVTQDGRTLWQRGTAHPAGDCLCSDLPVQIYDIDGDGNNEVICAIDFRLMILDGRTGEPKLAIDTPQSVGPFDAFPRTLGDAIHICNLSGDVRPREILFKDRHSKIWAYDSALRPVWEYHYRDGELSHVPFARDINGDGRDEILVGSVMLDSSGRPLWDLELGDHVDGGAVLAFDGVQGQTVALAASDEGFLFCDIEGGIRKRLSLGHVQTVVAGWLLPDRPGVQIATITYWGNPGIVYTLNPDGEVLHTFQLSTLGSVLNPVNWTGDGQALLLVSAAADTSGGLYTGDGRQAVTFPDDGHPDLCCTALDLHDAGHDDLLCWNHRELWVYGRSALLAPGQRQRTSFTPARHNESNYGARLLLAAPAGE